MTKPTAPKTISDAEQETVSASTRVRALFTPRERQVIAEIASGLSTKEIAAKLAISARTVGRHRDHIYLKCDARNIADLTRIAVRYGFITVEVVS